MCPAGGYAELLTLLLLLLVLLLEDEVAPVSVEGAISVVHGVCAATTRSSVLATTLGSN